MGIVNITLPAVTPSADVDALRLLVLAPLLEELIFRCGLQEALLRRSDASRFPGAAAANLLTAALFALCHVALQPGALAVLTFFPALVVGWVYQHTRRLAPCVLVHAAMNVAWLAGRHLIA